jgi:hypothetical protein
MTHSYLIGLHYYRKKVLQNIFLAEKQSNLIFFVF